MSAPTITKNKSTTLCVIGGVEKWVWLKWMNGFSFLFGIRYENDVYCRDDSHVIIIVISTTHNSWGHELFQSSHVCYWKLHVIHLLKLPAHFRRVLILWYVMYSRNDLKTTQFFDLMMFCIWSKDNGFL